MENELSDNMENRKLYTIVSIIFLLGILAGCAKNGGVCISSNGQLTSQVRSLPAFNIVDLRDNVSLILSTDTATRVRVEAGENIIGGISTQVTDGQLLIHNNNKCNWLRDYSKPVNVYISGNNLWKIKYNGSGNVTSQGTLKQDSINIEVWGGCGTLELTLNVGKGSFSLNMGTATYRLHGISSVTSAYMVDYGLYDARDMLTEYTFITNKGTNDCYVNASKYLEATIGSIGIIYYVGEPYLIQTHIFGSGNVLPIKN